MPSSNAYDSDSDDSAASRKSRAKSAAYPRKWRPLSAKQHRPAPAAVTEPSNKRHKSVKEEPDIRQKSSQTSHLNSAPQQMLPLGSASQERFAIAEQQLGRFLPPGYQVPLIAMSSLSSRSSQQTEGASQSSGSFQQSVYQKRDWQRVMTRLEAMEQNVMTELHSVKQKLMTKLGSVEHKVDYILFRLDERVTPCPAIRSDDEESERDSEDKESVASGTTVEYESDDDEE